MGPLLTPFLFLGLLATGLQSTFAQDNSGSTFYLVFHENYRGTSPTYTVFVTTSEETPVHFRIESPGTGYSTSGIAQQGQVTHYTFSSSYALSSSTQRDKSIIITTEDGRNLVVYGANEVQYTTDTFLALPTSETDSTTYKYVGAMHPGPNGDTVIAMVATSDGTQLDVTPTQSTTVGSVYTYSGRTTSLFLQSGETLLVRHSEDLTGTTVVSNKPISFVCGHQCTNVPVSICCCDVIVEQLPPVENWGNRFATAPLLRRQRYDRFRIVAGEAAATIRVMCTNSAGAAGYQRTVTLNENAHMDFDIPSTDFCYIEGNKKILLLQFSVGQLVDNVVSDPFMAMVPPIDQYSNSYTLATVPSVVQSYDHFLSIFIQAPFFQPAEIFLNDRSLLDHGTSFVEIKRLGDQTEVYAARVSVAEGSQSLYHSNPLARIGVLAYGFGSYNSYGYPGGLRLRDIEEADLYGVTVPEVAEDAVVITWYEPFVDEPVIAYDVDVFEEMNDDQQTLVQHHTTTETNIHLMDLDPGTNYSIEIEAIVESGNRIPSTVIDVSTTEITCEPPCANGGTCVQTDECMCSTGYTGSACSTDVNECFADNGGCGQVCSNTIGSYYCSCNPGYRLDGDMHRCHNIDECAENIDGCAHVCTDTAGSFQCSCRNGYSLGSDGRSCDDVDECSADNGGCGQVCSNTIGSYYCSCNPGYRLDGDMHRCHNIDECAENSDGCEHVCTDTAGSFQCSCRSGFRLGNNGKSCHDVDECSADNGGCGQVCSNTIGSYYCSCNPGYRLDGDMHRCHNIDECAENIDGCEHMCTDTAGSFQCSCRDGYRLGSDGRSCDAVCNPSCVNGGTCVHPNICSCLPGWTGLACSQGVNECATGNGGCAHTCSNTIGSYYCTCDPGYRLGDEGRRCRDIDECAENTNNCDQECANIDGSFRCSCEDGFRLQPNRRSCEDIDECAEDDHVCAHNCHNSVGSHSCSCYAGYRLSQDGKNCDDIDECAEDTDGCVQMCTNTAGYFACSCRDGFRLGSDGRDCSDIDECAEDDHVCAHNCHNSVGSHSCSCNAGYRLNPDGKNCDDINECAEVTAGCNQRCMNTAGNYTCACNHGYTLSTSNRHICVDIDECTVGNGGCQHNCDNTVGSYHCYCRTGYILDGDGRSCSNIDECTENSDGCEQICTDIGGSFECSCEDGFRLHSNEKSCEDVNECFIDADGCGHNCHNTEGAHLCSCDDGYMLNPNGRKCDDIDECALGTHLCNQICVNTPGTYTCTCNHGYALSTANEHTCHDIDECTVGNGGCQHNCNNTVGSYHCYCRTGYILDGDGRSCNDIDECAVNTDGCDQECANTDGSFGCSCRDGFRLDSDGRSCDDIDECAEDDHVCAHNCHNSDGSHSCSCYAGYRLNPDRKNCDDINECVEDTAGCNQRCMNTPGNYTCACYRGYTLSTANRHICLDVNECATGNGGCGHTCNNTLGSYYCTCDPGYRLGDNRHRCHNIDECAENIDGCEHMCTDTDGSFECSCRIGYSLGSDGKSCDDVNECAANNGGCEHACSNTIGSFYCSCPTGYNLIWDARRCEEFTEGATVDFPVNPQLQVDIGDIRCSDSDCVISVLLQLVGYFLDTDGDGVGDYTDDGDTFIAFFNPEMSISITDVLKAILNGNQNDIVLPFNPIVRRYSFTRSTLVSICELFPIKEQEIIYPGILWINDITITVELVGIDDPQINQILQQGIGHVGHIVFDREVVTVSADRWYIEGSRTGNQSNLPLTDLIDIFALQAVFSTSLDISAWTVDVQNMFAVFDLSQHTLAINIHGTLHISSLHSVSVCVVSHLSLNPQDRMDNRFAIVTDCNSDETGSFSLGEILNNVAQVDIGPVSQLNSWNLLHFRLFLTGASSIAFDEETAALLQFHVSCASVLAETVGSAILVDLSFTPAHSSFDPSLAGHCNMGRPFLIQITEDEDGRKAHFVPIEYSTTSYSSFRPHIISNITIDEFLDALSIEGLGDAHSTLLGGGVLGLHNISTFTYLISKMTMEVTSFVSGTLFFADGHIKVHSLSLITQASFTDQEVGKTAFLTGRFGLLQQYFDTVITLDLEEDAYMFKGYNHLPVNQRTLLTALGLPFHDEVALKFIGLFDFEVREPWITITSDSGVGNDVHEGETCTGGLLRPTSDNPFIGNTDYSSCVTNGDVQSSTAKWEIAGSSLTSLLESYTGEVVHQIPFLNVRTTVPVVSSDTTVFVLQVTYPTICTQMCQFIRQSQEQSSHFQLSIGINIDFGVSLEDYKFANKNSISSNELHDLGAVVEVTMTFPLAAFQFGAAWASDVEYRCVVVSDFSRSLTNAEVQLSVAVPLTLHFDNPHFELRGQVELMLPEHELALRAAGDGCVRLSATFSICSIHLASTVATNSDQIPGFVFTAQPMLGSTNCAAAGPLPYTAIVTFNPTLVYVEIDQKFTVADLMDYFCVDIGKVSRVLQDGAFPQGLVFSHGDVSVSYSNVNIDSNQLIRGTVDLFGVSAFAELHLNLPTSFTLLAVMDPISISSGFIKLTASRTDRYHGPFFYGSYVASATLDPVVAVNTSGSVNLLGQDVETMLVVDNSRLKLVLDAWIYQKVHVHIECEAGYGTPQNAAFSVIGHVSDRSLGGILDSIDWMYLHRSQYVTVATKPFLDQVAQATETYSKATADHSTVDEYTWAAIKREREAFHELADIQYHLDQWCTVDRICDECVAHEKCAKISFFHLLVRNSPCCLKKQSTTCLVEVFECLIVRESIITSIELAAAVWHSTVIQYNFAKTLLLESSTFRGKAHDWLQGSNNALNTVLSVIAEDTDFVSKANDKVVAIGDAVEGKLSTVIDLKAIQWEVEMSLFKHLEFDVSITAGFIDQTPKTCTGHVVLYEPASHVRSILCCLFDSFCEDAKKKRLKQVKPKPLILAELYRHTGNPFGERVK